MRYRKLIHTFYLVYLKKDNDEIETYLFLPLEEA